MNEVQDSPRGRVETTRANDRRKAPRYAPAIDAAQLGWWIGSHFHTSSARLEDISSGGAALAFESDAAMKPPIWLAVAAPGAPQWVKANIAGEPTAVDGKQRVRLEFLEACPYDVFKAAVWGDVNRVAAPAPVLPPTPSLTASDIIRSPFPAWEDDTTVARPARSRSATRPAAPPDTQPATPVSVTLPDRGELLKQTKRSKRGRVAMALDWIMPAMLCLSTAVMIVALAYITIADRKVLDPLVTCLCGE